MAGKQVTDGAIAYRCHLALLFEGLSQARYRREVTVVWASSSDPELRELPPELPRPLKRAERAQDLGRNRPSTHRRGYEGGVFHILPSRCFPSRSYLPVNDSPL